MNPSLKTAGLEHIMHWHRGHALLSLADMLRFLAKEAHESLQLLDMLAANPDYYWDQVEDQTPTHIKTFQSAILRVRKQAIEFELVETLGRCERFIRSLESCIAIQVPGSEHTIVLKRMSHAEIKSELGGISDAFWKELGDRYLAFVPTGSTKFFEQEALLGEEVLKKFPSAKDEIKDAGNCLAFGLHTAAVSHLMGAANTGLIALARHLRIKTKNLEYQEWHPIITAVRAKLESAHKLSRGPKKQSDLEFYAEILGEISALKDVHRNNVAHSRKRYNESEALGVYERVKTLMQRLATRLDE